MSDTSAWSITSLHQALQQHERVTSGALALALQDGPAPVLRLNLNGFALELAISGDQVLVDGLLVEASKVQDRAAFNDTVLRSRELFPLSSVCIEQVGGTAYYGLFGALSAESPLPVIVHEIDTLAENLVRASEAFADHFTA